MKVLLGITGGIAAYKMLSVASELVKNNHEVEVCMTEDACKFCTPLAFEAIIHRPVILSDAQFIGGCANQHIRLAQFADVMVIAPATANTVAKLASGIADNIVTLTSLACNCKKIVFPAMNVHMYMNEMHLKNLEILKETDQFEVIEANEGYLACGDIGRGRLAEANDIVEIIYYHALYEKDMAGKNVLINAGPTEEALDPVRFITNHSSGKMGYELARAFSYRGANVTLVSGRVNIKKPYGVDVINVYSAKEMYEKVTDMAKQNDIIVLSAAVADYTPIKYSEHKIKKKDGNLVVEFKRTNDILKELGKNKNYVLIGFAMETENLIENATKKLFEKKADIIVANSLTVEGAGFGGDTNVATLISKEWKESYEKMSKFDLANKIIDRVLKGV